MREKRLSCFEEVAAVSVAFSALTLIFLAITIPTIYFHTSQKDAEIKERSKQFKTDSDRLWESVSQPVHLKKTARKHRQTWENTPCNRCHSFHCPAGPIGPMGENAQDGLPGAAGKLGEHGPDGSDTEMGPIPDRPCEICRPGPIGPSGIQGERGEPGGKGLMGETGTAGNAGSDGGIGLPGAPGKKGFPGNPGYRGEQGENAIQGEGAQGSKGTSGPRGPPGSTGLPGRKARHDGHPGLPGEPGNLGPFGNKGSRGISGEYGEMGEPGAPSIYCPSDCSASRIFKPTPTPADFFPMPVAMLSTPGPREASTTSFPQSTRKSHAHKKLEPLTTAWPHVVTTTTNFNTSTLHQTSPIGYYEEIQTASFKTPVFPVSSPDGYATFQIKTLESPITQGNFISGYSSTPTSTVEPITSEANRIEGYENRILELEGTTARSSAHFFEDEYTKASNIKSHTLYRPFSPKTDNTADDHPKAAGVPLHSSLNVIKMEPYGLTVFGPQVDVTTMKPSKFLFETRLPPSFDDPFAIKGSHDFRRKQPSFWIPPEQEQQSAWVLSEPKQQQFWVPSLPPMASRNGMPILNDVLQSDRMSEIVKAFKLDQSSYMQFKRRVRRI